MESCSTRLSRAIQKRLQESSTGMYIRKRLPDGRVQVTGGKRLRSSGAYTAGFGKHVAKLLLKRKLQAAWLIILVSVSGSPHNL